MVPVNRNERYRARTHTTILIMFVSQLNRMFQPLAENMKQETHFCAYLFLDKKVANFDSTIFWVCTKRGNQTNYSNLGDSDYSPSLTYCRLARCAVNLKDWTDGNILPAELQFNTK